MLVVHDHGRLCAPQVVQVLVQHGLQVSVRAVAKHRAPVGLGGVIELVQQQGAVEPVEQASQPGCKRGGRLPEADVADPVVWAEDASQGAVGDVRQANVWRSLRAR